MIPPSWTRLPLRDKRTGSKRFSPKSTNGNESTRIEFNCRIRQLITARVNERYRMTIAGKSVCFLIKRRRSRSWRVGKPWTRCGVNSFRKTKRKSRLPYNAVARVDETIKGRGWAVG